MTPRDRQALNYIRAFIRRRRYSPTLREIGAAIGVSHVQARVRVQRLAEQGAVRVTPWCARAIELSQPETRHG